MHTIAQLYDLMPCGAFKLNFFLKLLTCICIIYFSVQDSKSAELKVLEFRRDCVQGLSNIVRKAQEKSPLKYATVRQLECLDPSVMFRDPDK